jgi:hypothetical protein
MKVTPGDEERACGEEHSEFFDQLFLLFCPPDKVVPTRATC